MEEIQNNLNSTKTLSLNQNIKQNKKYKPFFNQKNDIKQKSKSTSCTISKFFGFGGRKIKKRIGTKIRRRKGTKIRTRKGTKIERRKGTRKGTKIERRKGTRKNN